MGNEAAIQQLLWEMLQGHDLRLSQQQVGEQKDGRFNIIAQKGAPIEEAEHVVMVYVHTDTIKKKPEWSGKADYTLSRAGANLHGVGSYDMKAGVMLLTDILQTVDIPPGLTLVGAYCVGEERDSDGMKALMEWPHIRKVHLVLSPEIGTVWDEEKGNIESDSPKDIVVGRPGNVKSSIVTTAGGGHAFRINEPNTKKAMRTWLNHLEEALWKREKGEIRRHPDFVREHLNERDEPRGDKPGAEFESVPSRTAEVFSIRTVPPTNVEEIRAWQQQSLDRLMEGEHWGDQGLHGELNRYGTSYNPYIALTNSPDVQAVHAAVAKHYGEARFSVGQAVADGCWGHEKMNTHLGSPSQPRLSETIECPDGYVPWLDIGPLGNDAHHSRERVSEESLRKLIDFYRLFLTQYLPDHLGSRG